MTWANVDVIIEPQGFCLRVISHKKSRYHWLIHGGLNKIDTLLSRIQSVLQENQFQVTQMTTCLIFHHIHTNRFQSKCNQTFLFKKIHSKRPSAQYQPFCWDLYMLHMSTLLVLKLKHSRRTNLYHGCWCPGSFHCQVISNHQYSLYSINGSFFYTRNDFSYQCQLSIKKW